VNKENSITKNGAHNKQLAPSWSRSN